MFRSQRKKKKNKDKEAKRGKEGGKLRSKSRLTLEAVPEIAASSNNPD